MGRGHLTQASKARLGVFSFVLSPKGFEQGYAFIRSLWLLQREWVREQMGVGRHISGLLQGKSWQRALGKSEGGWPKEENTVFLLTR